MPLGAAKAAFLGAAGSGGDAGYILSIVAPDGDTSTQPDWYQRQMAPFSAADAKFYIQGQINNGYAPAPTSWMTQMVVSDTDMTVVSGSQKTFKTTSPAATSTNNSQQYNQDFVDSSDNIYGSFTQASAGGVSGFNSVIFFKVDSSYSLIWRMMIHNSNQNSSTSSWYPVTNGTYGICQFVYPSGAPATYGKRLGLMRVDISSSTPTWPQDWYYVTTTREASYDPWSGMDAYKGNSDGTDIYMTASGYAAAVQGPLVAKWAGPAGALSKVWDQFPLTAMGGTLILQESCTNTSGDTTICGYRSSGNPYPTWMIQYDDAGSINWQREWVHGTTGSYQWPTGGLRTDSSGNIYWFGTWTDTSDSGSYPNRMCLMKIDSSGNKVWIASATQTVGGANMSFQAMDMILSSDGGIIVSGYGTSSGIKQNFFMKLADTENPDGKSGTVDNTVDEWTFTWSDQTSVFTESTPTHTTGAWAYYASSTSTTGMNYDNQSTTGTPTYTALTSTDTTAGAF